MSEQQPLYTERRSLTWLETWTRAMTQPTETGYEAITSDPKGGYRRSMIWLALSSFLIYTVSALYLFASGPEYFTDSGNPFSEFFLYWMLCLGPISVIGSILSVGILAGFSHLIARMLGGTGRFETLYYTFTAYLSPLSIISFILSLVPYAACLGLPLGLYSMYLNILSVKTVHRFGWGQAFFSSVAIMLFLVALVAVCVIVLLAMMGPAIGTVFSNIIEEIVTPVP